MLVAVSISLSQSSNLVVSHWVWGCLGVRMWWGFICCCVVHRVTVYCYIAVYLDSSTSMQGECSCNIKATWCSFSVRCARSSTCAGGLVIGPSLIESFLKLLGMFLQLCHIPPEGWCPQCTQQLFHYLGLVYWVAGVVSRGAGISSPSSYMTVWSLYVVVMLWVLWHFPLPVVQGLERWLSLAAGHQCVGLCLCWEGGKRGHLPGKGCADHYERLLECCHWILLVDGRWVFGLFTMQVSSALPLQGISAWHQCKGTNMWEYLVEGTWCVGYPGFSL